MKKRLLVVSLLAIIISVIIIIWGFTQKNEQRFSGIQMNESMCYLLFDCTPTEFFDKNFSFYEETGDFRKKSYVDSRGWLMLIFTEEQGEKWAQTEWLNTFPEIVGYPVEINEELDTITIYAAAGLVTEDVSDAVNKVLAKLDILKHFSEIPDEDNYTTIVVIDSETGKIFSTETHYNGPKI